MNPNDFPLSRHAGWHFDNSYLRLPDVLFARQHPTPVANPAMFIWNSELGSALGLDSAALDTPEGAAIFAGNRIPDGADPIAQSYAGHQFGNFTRLGDGRAILMGEQITPSGLRLDLQWKGSGPTPYSRRGDGRAALGPMLREFIISEAMHGLGIPTTRSLAVVTTGEAVYRDGPLPGAVLTRVAASHIRVGTFEFASALQDPAPLNALTTYTLGRHFPECQAAEIPALALLDGVVAKQSELIARWMLVGFVHGVMNTDNMALSGETIDYGPCAFLDTYDVQTVFSSIDQHGRYAYGNQPQIGQWNLARFAETLLPLIDSDEKRAIELASGAVERFGDQFRHHWLDGMRSKLGLVNAEDEDVVLIQRLLARMQATRADYTFTFRALSLGTPVEAGLDADPEFAAWRREWIGRRTRQEVSPLEVSALMLSTNPAVIARNQHVERALETAVTEGDTATVDQLVATLRDPFSSDADRSDLNPPPPPGAAPYRTFCGT